jgi:hypothetical protein
MLIKEAHAIAGSIGYPSKMPGTSYGLSAEKCITGSKLAQIEGSTCFNCYALKGNYIYPSVKAAHEKRLAGINHPAWPKAMAGMLRAAHRPNKKGEQLPPFHRWHDSGDLQSIEHLEAICEVARLTPELMHWIPSRELAILKAFLAKGGIVPDNLIIRISATMVDGAPTKAWPHTSTVQTKRTAESCPSLLNDGKCGACRRCWDKSIPNIPYPIH